jgi:hypothetical protein
MFAPASRVDLLMKIRWRSTSHVPDALLQVSYIFAEPLPANAGRASDLHPDEPDARWTSAVRHHDYAVTLEWSPIAPIFFGVASDDDVTLGVRGHGAGGPRGRPRGDGRALPRAGGGLRGGGAEERRASQAHGRDRHDAPPAGRPPRPVRPRARPARRLRLPALVPAGAHRRVERPAVSDHSQELASNTDEEFTLGFQDFPLLIIFFVLEKDRARKKDTQTLQSGGVHCSCQPGTHQKRQLPCQWPTDGTLLIA